MIFSFFQKNWVLGYTWSTLLWYRCYYLHRSRDSLSPVCGIFQFESAKSKTNTCTKHPLFPILLIKDQVSYVRLASCLTQGTSVILLMSLFPPNPGPTPHWAALNSLAAMLDGKCIVGWIKDAVGHPSRGS